MLNRGVEFWCNVVQIALIVPDGSSTMCVNYWETRCPHSIPQIFLTAWVVWDSCGEIALELVPLVEQKTAMSLSAQLFLHGQFVQCCSHSLVHVVYAVEL